MSDPTPHTSISSVVARLGLPLAFNLTLALLVSSEPVQAFSSQDQGTGSKSYDTLVSPFLSKYCFECHAIEKSKGDLRLDRLPIEFADRANVERWLAVLDRLKSGEMPPKSKPRPPKPAVDAICGWIDESIASANSQSASDKGRVVLRRLNRVEYENTMRDLLAINVDLKELLPPDTSADGFDNSGEALHVSSFLMERYLEAADKALNLAIANEPQPPTIRKRFSCKDERQVKNAEEPVFRQLDDTVVLFSSSPWSAITLSQFYPPDRGDYRIRISAYAYQSDRKPVTFQVVAGPMLMGTKNHLVGYFDAAADTPGVIEFVDHLEARSTIRILPFGIGTAFTVKDAGGADEYNGAGLAVEWIEVEGPLHDCWPPESHRRIFGELTQRQALLPDHRVEVVSDRPGPDSRRILTDFARRAFRRAVTENEIRPILDLVEAKLTDGTEYSFEQAVRVGLKAILVSPEFLFLQEKPGKLDESALASRLSYFLWSTMPDTELLALAEQKQLSRPDVLHGQVERLLGHPKARSLTENFIGQWLSLRDIDFTEPDRRLYPEFDDMLKEAMVQETYQFFDEVLKHDLSVTNLVASDFTMLNERLAKHYGIPGVEGHAFRRVTLPTQSHRGGVMTMASVLKVTANGTNTSPVVRGAWVLDRILGTPPKPPPGGVPAIEPDIRGATTIREQLAKHRQVESCSTCHAQIDPPGFALESFDVIGGWRDYYRSVGNGKPVTIDGRRQPYAEGPAVDPADVLPDGKRFQNIDEFKQLLLADKDKLARSLTTKLVTYATGRAPQAAHHPAIDNIVTKVRAQDYGLRSLVHEIVASDLFQDK
jgi:Protein of unknown function (DUF1592)/Protein of unknown function (DUF1588)/Protein of unknown function (DUF1587)/Protein of unknown function (DUF1585)/Protein of unknown function (DUF1595)/Planctomycete cytochrome C